MNARLNGQTAPILPSRDLSATVEFYTRLGFTVDGRYPDDGYLIISRDDVELHFFSAPDMSPLADAHAVYLRLDTDVRAVHEEWSRLGITDSPTGNPRLLAPEMTGYGMLEFALVDPDGNLFRIGAEIP
ncbi:bleomycin resistance protein [Thermomonospora umbrina]|uniref:bleomycin resistance protein n=1 Tax=Thermomonospora umbrina TaxID=111806 RepID=UPI0014771BBC|nr:VOC family protein [Thermomonospora umbrina]